MIEFIVELLKDLLCGAIETHREIKQASKEAEIKQASKEAETQSGAFTWSNTTSSGIATSKPRTDLWLCPHCGAKNRNDLLYCPVCQASKDDGKCRTNDITCPNCGAKNNKDRAQCYLCDTPLR